MSSFMDNIHLAVERISFEMTEISSLKARRTQRGEAATHFLAGGYKDFNTEDTKSTEKRSRGKCRKELFTK
jgi:hypothetical protein